MLFFMLYTSRWRKSTLIGRSHADNAATPGADSRSMLALPTPRRRGRQRPTTETPLRSPTCGHAGSSRSPHALMPLQLAGDKGLEHVESPIRRRTWLDDPAAFRARQNAAAPLDSDGPQAPPRPTRGAGMAPAKTALVRDSGGQGADEVERRHDWCRRSDSNRHGGLTPAGF
jgi:hypothetical protein